MLDAQEEAELMEFENTFITKIQDSPFDRLTFCFLFYASGQTFVGGARIVNGAEKKSFDRGGPAWPPRSSGAASIKCDEQPFKGRVWWGFAPPAQNRGVGGTAPPS